MPYQNDMQTLANVVSPAYAAMQAGIQNDTANDKAAMENQQYAGQMPAEIAKPGLQNLFTQAQTGQVGAMTDKLNLENQLTGATMPGTIGATNSGNQAKMTASQAQSMGNLGTIAGQVAAMMDNVPAAARPAAMQSVLAKYGVDPSKLPPQFMSGDPDMLRQASASMIQASSGYKTAMDETNAKVQGSVDVANIGADARVTAAEQAAGARLQAAQVAAQAKQMSQNFEQAAVAAERAGNHDLARQYYQASINTKAMAAQNTAGLLNMQVPDPGFGAGGGSGGQPQAPAGNTPNAVPNQSALEAEMRRRGLLK